MTQVISYTSINKSELVIRVVAYSYRGVLRLSWRSLLPQPLAALSPHIHINVRDYLLSRVIYHLVTCYLSLRTTPHVGTHLIIICDSSMISGVRATQLSLHGEFMFKYVTGNCNCLIVYIFNC